MVLNDYRKNEAKLLGTGRRGERGMEVRGVEDVREVICLSLHCHH